MTELKNCPCCASNRVHIHEVSFPEDRTAIKCLACGVQVVKDYTNQAVEIWNTRTERTCDPAVRPSGGACWRCSACDEVVTRAYRYCPGCAARIIWNGGGEACLD